MNFRLGPIPVGVIFTLAGIALFMGSFFWYKQARDQDKNWIVTKGQVVEYQFQTYDRSSAQDHRKRIVYRYCPLVEFQTENGEIAQALFHDSNGLHCLKTDEQGAQNKAKTRLRPREEFRYNPRSPQHVTTASAKALYYPVWILIVMGIVFSALGLGLFLSGLRK